MEKGKDFLKAYLTGLKESCSSVCLWSGVRHKNSTHGRSTRKAIKFLSHSSKQTTIKVMSQRYNKLHVLHRKKTKLPKEVILVSKEVTSLCAITPNIYLKNCSFGNPTSTT